MNIKAAQEKLLALGYKLPVYGADGSARPGGETYKALEAFLRDHVPMDLGADGRLSPGEEFDRVLAALDVWPVEPKKLEDWNRDAARLSGKLHGVDKRLVQLVETASEGAVAFRVVEGMRTARRQAELVASGASKTLNSRHLTGHAVDLAPWVGGEISWHWPHYYALAREVCVAATRIGLAGSLTWGGVWDKRVIGLEPGNIPREVSEYTARERGLGRRAFIDGPHWQLHWTAG